MQTLFLSSLSFCSFTWISLATYRCIRNSFAVFLLRNFRVFLLCFHLSLFNFQSAIPLSFLTLPLRQPVYYITASSVCQGGFLIFSKFFLHSEFFLFPRLFLTARLLYHKLLILSSTFWKFLKKIFQLEIQPRSKSILLGTGYIILLLPDFVN